MPRIRKRITRPKIKQPQAPIIEPLREAKDEMNLAVFPIAALYSKISKNVRSLKFQDTIVGENGKLVRRSWTVQGGSEVGLPTSTDEDVYVALMELTRRQGFDDQKVPFSRYDLVRRLGWCPCGKCYQRLEDSLLRLSNVFIHAQNAFWDNEARAYVTVGFTLIQGYHLYDETARRKAGKPGPMSWILWSDQLYRSFKSGYIKFLDTNLYFNLRTATSRRLYRYLDKKFGNDDKFATDVFKLAHEHLGISRNFRYSSEIVRQLAPALNELTDEGYLKNWKLDERIISFVKSKSAKHEAFDTSDETLFRTLDLPFDSVTIVEDEDGDSARIERMLIERGVASGQARKIIETNSQKLQAVEQTVVYFDKLMGRAVKRITNPAGLLVTLIREGKFESPKETEARLDSAPPQVNKVADEMAYQEFVEREVDKHVESLADGEYKNRLERKKTELLASDRGAMYRRWAKQVFEDYVSILCRREIAENLKLPDFESWSAEKGTT
jgi:plasmid replication initiation protein